MYRSPSGDYGAPNCLMESEGQYMSIELRTDGFTEGPGFRATHIAVFASPEPRKSGK